jgi:hypothetical protein
MARRASRDVLPFAGFGWREDVFWLNDLVFMCDRRAWPGWFCGARRRRKDGWRCWGQEGDEGRFDDGVQGECCAGLALAGCAVAAVDDEGPGFEAVPDEAAGAAAFHWEDCIHIACHDASVVREEFVEEL